MSSVDRLGIPNPESLIQTESQRWFAIWTRSRHEQVVREQLERKRFEAFLPTITRWSRWKDRKKKIDWPLFPGYCFARFDPADTLPILKCTGVVNIVSFEGKPASIPEIEIDSIKKDNKIETEEQFQAALKQENMTMADLRRSFERQMIVSRVEQNEVFGKVGVSEDEARRYYDAHLGEFTAPPTVILREILIGVPADAKGLNVARDDAAKDKADAIRARVASGESFEKLAADMSDAPSRANAGLIGPISVKELSPEFQQLIAAMKPGDISQPIHRLNGYQVLKLESSSGAQTLPFDQAREQISDHVFAGKRQVEFQKYRQKLRAEAIIEWKNADIKKAYEQGVAMQAKAGS